jgi:hypothetical protein
LTLLLSFFTKRPPFGPRVGGLQISRHGDGTNFERRLVKNSAMLVYTAGRSYLLELPFAVAVWSDQNC